MRTRCLTCGTLILRGSYCKAHKPYGPGWAPLRAEILRRDDYRCRCNGCGSCYPEPIGSCLTRANTVDHIDGNALNNEPSNLRAMCRPCNTAKGGIA